MKYLMLIIIVALVGASFHTDLLAAMLMWIAWGLTFVWEYFAKPDVSERTEDE